MSERINCAGLQVDSALHQLLVEEIAPGTGVSPDVFWQAMADVLKDFMPRNAALLATRDALQSKLDGWHREHPGDPNDPDAYRKFLEEIDYLLPQPDSVAVTTENVDEEIADIAGPQLVVPVMNARFALNAVNAR